MAMFPFPESWHERHKLIHWLHLRWLLIKHYIKSRSCVIYSLEMGPKNKEWNDNLNQISKQAAQPRLINPLTEAHTPTHSVFGVTEFLKNVLKCVSLPFIKTSYHPNEKNVGWVSMSNLWRCDPSTSKLTFLSKNLHRRCLSLGLLNFPRTLNRFLVS